MQEVYENLYILLFWLGGRDLQNWVQDRFDKGVLISEAESFNHLIRRIGGGHLFTLFNSRMAS